MQFKTALLRVLSTRGSRGIQVYTGHLLDASAVFHARLFSNHFGIAQLNVHAQFECGSRTTYPIHDSLSAVFNDSSVSPSIGSNIKLESPILNIRVKNNSFANSAVLRIGYIGTSIKANYAVIHIGISSAFIRSYYHGKSFSSHALTDVTCIAGSSVDTIYSCALGALDNDALHHTAHYLCLYSGDVTMLELCASSAYTYQTSYANNAGCAMAYLLGADYVHNVFNRDTYVVYQGASYG